MIKLPFISLKQAAVACVLMLGTVLAAQALTPKLTETAKPDDLEAMVPRSMGTWQEQPNPYTQVGLTAGDDKSIEQPYDRVLMRSYRNAQNASVMLALAYAREQTQDIKIHRPEVCYRAQGFTILDRQEHIMPTTAYPDLKIVRLLVSREDRLEAVSYWIRVGSTFPVSALAMRMQILRDGLAGQVDDGILVRASTIIDSKQGATSAYASQETFLMELARAPGLSGTGLLLPGA